MTYQPTLPCHKRWATADIDYVREQSAKSTVRQIAEDLGEPLGRVRHLVYSLRKGAHTPKGKTVRSKGAVQIDFLGGTRPEGVEGSTSASPVASGASEAPKSQPADLTAFVKNNTVRDVALALKISRATVYRLQDGYWPADSRALLAVWEAYKGRTAQQQGSWFVRRVYAGGLVRHAGLSWTAPGLAVRTGELLAVARTVDGNLLVQTLDLPAERITLQRLEG